MILSDHWTTVEHSMAHERELLIHFWTYIDCIFVLGWAVQGQIICLCQGTGVRSAAYGSRDWPWILTLKSYKIASQVGHSGTVPVL